MAGDIHSRLVELRHAYERDGYVMLEQIVPRAPLGELAARLVSEWEEQVKSGALFAGGGTLHGHLNCFPGEGSRFVLDALTSAGVVDLVRALSQAAVRAPNVGCNLNLPGSHPQNEHVDGYAATPFAIINVAVVDTTIENGAMEIMPATHLREYKYWEIALGHTPRMRVAMRQGDVVVRTSMLWHRGMPNLSQRPRPMLAFTWEDGGSPEVDPYRLHGGQIKLLPNRFTPDWKGRLLERAFVASPKLGVAVRVAKSFIE